jgi:hypothetical protein
MPIKVTCPKCQGVLHAPDDAGGKRGKCPTCGTVLAIPNVTPPAADPSPFGSLGASAPAASPAEERRSPLGGGIPEPDARRDFGGRSSSASSSFGSAEPARRPVAEPLPQSTRAPLATPTASPAAVDEEIRSWRRMRRGLWWMRCAYFFLMLSVVAPIGLKIAEHYGVALPTDDPGFLQVQRISQDTEIRLATMVVPLALALPLLIFGRLGVSNAPYTSYSKGLLGMSTIATLFGVGGFVAFAVPTGGQIMAGVIPEKIGDFITDDINGHLQRIGFFLMITLLPVAEFWFLAGLGRVGAALRDDRLASRVSRLAIYVGLGGIISLAAWGASNHYSSELDRFLAETVKPQWDKVGEHQFVVIHGAIILAALIVWFLLARVVGAARRAVWNWLERNDPNT